MPFPIPTTDQALLSAERMLGDYLDRSDRELGTLYVTVIVFYDSISLWSVDGAMFRVVSKAMDTLRIKSGDQDATFRFGGGGFFQSFSVNDAGETKKCFEADLYLIRSTKRKSNGTVRR